MDRDTSEIFKALSVPSRIHILSLLKHHGPMPVKNIAEAVGMSSPAVSQHLKILKHAGMVSARRDGYSVPYELDVAALHDCCGQMIKLCACPEGQCKGHGKGRGGGRRKGNAQGDEHDASALSDTERLLLERERLLAKLQHIEQELETLR